jgi:phosphoribosylamine--glycine ligase
MGFRKEASACIVLSSQGYPEKPVKGEPIEGLAEVAAMEGVEVFHAGTKKSGDQVVSAGGRVLNVCATGPQLRDALKRAYGAAARIHWPSKISRHDIGRRVIERSA